MKTLIATLKIIAIALIAITAHANSKANALIEIDINQGTIEPLPIAIAPFLGSNQYSQNIVNVIENNLKNSGLFKTINQNAFIENIQDFNKRPRFGDWRLIQAQALVVGKVNVIENNQIKAEFRLWDTLAEQQMEALQFVTTQANWRRIGHIISDAIYSRLTGEKGYFDTRIVFIEETGPKNRRTKKLTIMDQDGQNIRYLTTGRNLVLTPRFNPAARQVAYMVYDGGTPKVYIYDLKTGQQKSIGIFRNMTFAPRFSPSGQEIVMSLQDKKNTDIFTMNLNTQTLKRITSNPAIDTAPSFSPDGNNITFESDREGSQQIYVMNKNGTNVRRISYGKGRYSTPVWSPRGDHIAFTKMYKGRFLIGVMKPDGSGERILTEGYHNEGPTWSPNGRVIMFFRESPGENGGPKLWSVDLTGYNEKTVNTKFFASDPAWSNLEK